MSATAPNPANESLGRLSGAEAAIAPRVAAFKDVRISVDGVHTTIEVECADGRVVHHGREITGLFTVDQLAKLAR